MTDKLYIGKREINIDRQLLDSRAEDIFMDISGIRDRSGRKFDKMRKDALRVLQDIREKIHITAECRFYEDVLLSDKRAVIAGTEFIGSAFEQLQQEMIEGAYLYVISAGNVSLPEAKVIEQLYADYWGNAYTDALRELLRTELEKETMLSDGFGPGFYGMETVELVKLGQMLDFDSKGISVKNDQIMIPLKTCSGIYFKVNEKYNKLDAACESCLGNQKSCSMCIVYRGE